MRPLVGEDVPGLVRLDGERDDHAPPLTRDAVRADVLLDEQPRGGVRLPLEDAFVQPFAVEAPGGLGRLRQGQVDDVVRASPEQALALGRRDGVVRGRHEIGSRAGRAGVTDGAKRLQYRHRGERTNGSRS